MFVCVKHKMQTTNTESIEIVQLTIYLPTEAGGDGGRAARAVAMAAFAVALTPARHASNVFSAAFRPLSAIFVVLLILA